MWLRENDSNQSHLPNRSVTVKTLGFLGANFSVLASVLLPLAIADANSAATSLWSSIDRAEAHGALLSQMLDRYS